VIRLRALLLHVCRLFRNRHSDQDLRDQIGAHLEEAIEEYVPKGAVAG